MSPQQVLVLLLGLSVIFFLYIFDLQLVAYTGIESMDVQGIVMCVCVHVLHVARVCTTQGIIYFKQKFKYPEGSNKNDIHNIW